MFTRRVLVTTIATIVLTSLPVVAARAPIRNEQATPAAHVMANGPLVTVDFSMPGPQAISGTRDRSTAVG